MRSSIFSPPRSIDMKKSIAVIAALAASFSLAAFAQDNAKAARKAANETYKAEKEACKPMKGDEHKNCMKQAKSKHEQAIAEAKAMKKESKSSTSGASTAPARPATS